MPAMIAFCLTFVSIMSVAVAVSCVRDLCLSFRASRNVAHRIASMHARVYRSRDDIIARNKLGIA